MFGFCLDFTDTLVPLDAIFTVEGEQYIPDRFPKNENGRMFAYFKVKTQECKRCCAKCIPDYDVESLLTSWGIEGMDYEGLADILMAVDPGGKYAKTCSDRVYDIQFEEWGVDGMPTRYLFVKDRDGLIGLLLKAPVERKNHHRPLAPGRQS